jgi:hypothetical protein
MNSKEALIKLLKKQEQEPEQKVHKDPVQELLKTMIGWLRHLDLIKLKIEKKEGNYIRIMITPPSGYWVLIEPNNDNINIHGGAKKLVLEYMPSKVWKYSTYRMGRKYKYAEFTEDIFYQILHDIFEIGSGL